MGAGRCEYGAEVVDRICNEIAAGTTLRQFDGRDDLPPSTTLDRWLEQYPELRSRYARARELSGQVSESNIVAIQADLRSGVIDANQARVLLDAERWLAAKRAPRTHGDRIELEHSGQVNTGIVVNFVVGRAEDGGKAIDVEPVRVALPDVSANTSTTLDK